MHRSVTRHAFPAWLWLLCCGATTALFAAPFPGDLPGTQIGGGLAGNYEPSGAVWHTRLQRLFLVSDGGIVTSMNADGSGVQNWQIGGDLEGICVADPDSNRIYLGVENPDSIREFDIATGQVLRTFDLTATMQGAANSGLEGLTFVPDAQHPEGGLFYAGLQADGKIYVFNVPILTSTTSTTVTHVTTITPVAGRGDISGLDYHIDSGVLYAVFDSSNKIRAMTASGALIGEWDLPGNDQEGVAMRDCDVFIAEDVGVEVWRYGFPADSGDDDGDAVANCDDLCPATPGGTLVDLDGCTATGGCIDDSDCSDDVFCNGVETCDGGACSNGTPVSCDDGLACTTDTCNEAADTCDHQPDDSACDDGSFCTGAESCDPFGGCQTGTAPACPGQQCSDPLAACVDCLVESDCGASEVCDSSSGQCETPPPGDPLPVDPDETWRYFKGVSEPAAGWTARGFDDTGWSSGSGGFGYGSDCQAQHGVVLNDMQNGYTSVYLRHAFDVADVGALASLTLTLDYDDAFVAYLNGVEVARGNVVGTPPAHDQTAVADHECSGSATQPNPPETFVLGTGSVVAGMNVLALQGHNLSLGSSDFSLIPTLVGVPLASCFDDGDCDDGSFCNGTETCVGGSCEAGSPIDCNDGIACTADSCNEAADRCDHAANDAICDDGQFCNGAETCGGAGCEPGVPPACPGGLCSPSLGECVECLEDADCAPGEQCNGASATCESAPECTVDADCHDGDDCSVDQCNAGSCSHSSPDADGDGVPDCVDNCRERSNAGQSDFDGDSLGDACEVGSLAADINLSGRVDGLDLAELARAFSSNCGESRHDARADLDMNCVVDGDDLAALATYFGLEVDLP